MYDCNDSSFIWGKISSIVGFVVCWKNIVIDFNENSDFNYDINTLISYTAINIYKYKIKCRLTNSKSDRETLYNVVQSSLKTTLNIAGKSYNYVQIKSFKKKICIDR